MANVRLVNEMYGKDLLENSLCVRGMWEIVDARFHRTSSYTPHKLVVATVAVYTVPAKQKHYRIQTDKPID